MIDRKHIGKKLAPLSVEVEQGQLKFFAKATAENNPIYSDVAAAQAAGHPGLPAPPTFAFSLRMAKPDPFDWLSELGVDLGKVLHAEQSFEYSGNLVYAGDTILLETEISDIYDKKQGALEFIISQTRVSNQRGEYIGSMTESTVVRNG